MMQYTLLFTQEPEWWFTVEVVELPGCVTYGETLEEAEMMIKDAIQAYRVSQKQHAHDTYTTRKTFMTSVMVHEAV